MLKQVWPMIRVEAARPVLSRTDKQKGKDMARSRLIAVTAASLMVAGCASSPASYDPYGHQPRSHQVGCLAGTVGGAIIGGLAGSLIGAGTGQLIATGAGAAAGGVLGHELACP